MYDEAANLLWSEIHNKVFVGGGLFHVLLGTKTPLNLPFDEPYFLGIQVNNDPELQPCMMMTSAAYSLNAERVGGIAVSGTPQSNTLLPLDNSGKFPPSVLPTIISGDYLKKDTPDTSSGTSTHPMLLISNLGDGDGIDGQSGNGIGVSCRSTNNYGMLARSENSHSIYIPGSGAAGVYVKDAGSHGVDVVHATGNGVQVYSAEGHGVLVHSAKIDGVNVSSADRNGVYVSSAKFDGFFVNSADRDGVRVNSANGNGVQVKDAGHDGLRVVKAGSNGLRIYENVAQNYIYAGSDADADFRVSNNGTAYADGGWQGAADFAELIETDSPRASYEPGDVLVISHDKDRTVTLSSEPYSTSIVGVFSTRPGFVGSTHPMEDRYENEIPVAIVGIVPCKVSTENGSIQRGDLLTTSSTPGYAMKATEAKIGAVLGKALESLERGNGKIEVLITLQ